MFFVVVCSCGSPVGVLWRRYMLAKMLSFTKHTEEMAGLLEAIEKVYKGEFERVRDFLHTSQCHMRVF